jgi:hypothetical protein
VLVVATLKIIAKLALLAATAKVMTCTGMYIHLMFV